MSYEEFLQAIPGLLQDRLGGEAKVSLHTVYKNNNQKREMLCILEEGSNVSPTIYLRPFYEAAQEGMELEAVLNGILAEYRRNRCGLYLDVDEFQRFDRVSSRVVYKLINYERNQEMLALVPHRRFLDLAVVYYLLIENYFIGNGTATVQNRQMKLWQADEEKLFALAEVNTKKRLGGEILPMEQVVHDILLEDLSRQIEETPGGGDLGPQDVEELAGQILTELMPEKHYEMYVMSNTERYFGAAALLDDGLLAEFAAQKNSGFYVLPSSIHEVILLPDTEPLSVEDMRRMLTGINENGVSGQEYLSDQVYYYNRETGKLSICGDSAPASAGNPGER